MSPIDDEPAHARALAEAVREACARAAADAFRDGGFAGLCTEGRVELALDAIRAVALAPIIDAHRGGADHDP